VCPCSRRTRPRDRRRDVRWRSDHWEGDQRLRWIRVCNVEVCANGVSSGGCASTNASGEYTIWACPPAPTRLNSIPSFEGPFLRTSHYLRQFDRGIFGNRRKHDHRDRRPRCLRRPGHREGDQVGRNRTRETSRCAAFSGEGECGTTNANGEYTISALQWLIQGRFYRAMKA